MSRRLIQDLIIDKKDVTPTRSPSWLSVKKTKDIKPIYQEKKESKVVKKEKEFKIEHKRPEKISKNSQISLWILSTVSIFALIFLLSSTFATAKITITPKSEKITVDNTLTSSSKGDSADIYFETVSSKMVDTKTIDTDGEEYVERKAVGKVAIYNNFSTTKQRLVSNTRLESTNGLIYKIRQSVDVPGYKIISGVRTPGSIEVDIIADIAGDKYNMEISDLKGDFKIPGFKSTPKYNSFYGRLTTDVSGGFVGKVKKLSEEKLQAGIAELRNSLKEKLIKDLYEKKPSQYLIFKDNYYISYKDIPDSSEDPDKITIGEEATIYAPMFKKTDLATVLAKIQKKNPDNSLVDIIIGDEFLVKSQSTDPSVWASDTIKLRLAGEAQIVWVYDAVKLTESILGQNKKIISSLISDSFKPAIQSISVIIRPQWRQSFPEKASKITVFDSIRNVEVAN